MSHTDSLEDHATALHSPDGQRLLAVAQQLQMTPAVLSEALRQIEQYSPASGAVCLQLLQSLGQETLNWKAEPQARLIELILASPETQGAECAEALSLHHAVRQLYPELFRLESSIDS